jgi:outer membrane immunogenic protein
MKRKVLTGLAALTLFDIVAAQAQTNPGFNWTGVYAGGHVGYRWGNVNTNLPVGGFPPVDFISDSFGITGPPPFFNFPVTQNPDSPVIGFHTGYNYQFAPTWLVGIETSWSWGRGESYFSVGPAVFDADSGGASYRTQLSWSGSVRGRFGYVANNWLFYGTGGVAFQRFSLRGSGFVESNFAGDSFSVVTNFSGARTLFGWVVGAGIENHLGNGWTWRVEYLFADFGTVNVGSATSTASLTTFDSFSTSTSSQPINVRVYTQTIRFGFSKLFSVP